VYADTTARGHMRNAFEAGSGIVSNWDVMESVLDYVFIKMGIESNGGIDMPIVMTEAVANLPYSRKCKFFGDILADNANIKIQL
jgi:actin-related protein 5